MSQIFVASLFPVFFYEALTYCTSKFGGKYERYENNFQCITINGSGRGTQHFGTTTCGPGQIQMLDEAKRYIHDTTVIGETKLMVRHVEIHS